jgi:amidophosphoribosyltransferase
VLNIHYDFFIVIEFCIILVGNLGIGHTRYSTSAASEEVNCQPFVVHTAYGPLAVAHNGELVNCSALRRWVRF